MLAVTRLNPNTWWYLARAGGLVAWGLLAASVFWGLWFSGRLSRKVPPRAWALDLHRFLGALSLVFVAVHILALTADKYVDFGLPQVLVPFASHWRPGAVAWGITAFYLLLAVEITSALMRYMPKKAWHSVHLLSFLLFAFSTVHAIQSGTDVHNPVVQALGIMLLVSAIVVAVLRVAKELDPAKTGAASRTVVGTRPALFPRTPDTTRSTPAWPPPAPDPAPSAPAWPAWDPPAPAARQQETRLPTNSPPRPAVVSPSRREPRSGDWAGYGGLGAPLARRPKVAPRTESPGDDRPRIPVGR